MKLKAKVEGSLHIAKNALDESEMWLLRSVHVKAYLLDYISDVRACRGEVLEGTDQTPIVGWVGDRGTISSR